MLWMSELGSGWVEAQSSKGSLPKTLWLSNNKGGLNSADDKCQCFMGKGAHVNWNRIEVCCCYRTWCFHLQERWLSWFYDAQLLSLFKIPSLLNNFHLLVL